MWSYLVLGAICFGLGSLFNRSAKVRLLLALSYAIYRYFRKSDTAFHFNDSHTSSSITYAHRDMTYIVNVPYISSYVPKMINITAILVKDGSHIDITQQPGIPYMCSARMLGGDKIILVDTLAETQHVFERDEVPNFKLM